MESGDDGLESEANVRPRPRLTRAGRPRSAMDSYRWRPVAGSLAQARLNRSAKGAGTGHSPRYPKCGTTQSDRLLDARNSASPSPRRAGVTKLFLQTFHQVRRGNASFCMNL